MPKQEGRASLVSTSPENVRVRQLKFFDTLRVSTNDHEKLQVLILGLQVNFRK